MAAMSDFHKINMIKMMHDNNKLTISQQPSCMVVAKDIK